MSAGTTGTSTGPRASIRARRAWSQIACGAIGALALCAPGSARPVNGVTFVDLTGPQNGPFSAASVTLPITNETSGNIVWGVRQSPRWATFSSTSGALPEGGSTSVQVSINSTLASALPVGTYDAFVLYRSQPGQPLGHLATVRLTVHSPNAQSMTTASRTSGVAPLAVYFDAVGSGSGVVQPGGATPDYSALHYRWNFGDLAAGTWAVSGKSKNSSIGYQAAHVFETPGTYQVRLQVTEASGTLRDYRQTITVTDPAQVYAGQTYYVSSTQGNDANNGLTPGAPFRTVARAMSTLFASNGPRQVLLRRGETHVATSTISASGRTGPYTIGAYGSGADPLISASHSGDGIYLSTSVSDVRIVDVDISASGSNGEGVQFGRDSLLLRSTVQGFRVNVGGHASGCIANTVADCTLLNAGHYGLYYSGGNGATGPNDPPIHLAVLGTRFDNSIGNSLLRTYVSRSLWQSNLFLRAGASSTRVLGLHSPKKSEFILISDNRFDSLQTWVLEIGPENDENGNGVQQIVENVIVEGNHFSLPGPGAVSRFVLIWGRLVTVRNNIFDHTGASWGGTILVDRRGIGPVPTGVKIDNNTVYRGDAAPTFRFVEATSQDMTLVRNNIVYSPAVASTVATGTVTLQGNETGNPQFNDPGDGDFRLRWNSPAIDNGLSLTMRIDYQGNLRPAQAVLCDAGALERL